MRRNRNPGRLVFIIASLAILLAPFIALLYAPEAGLAVMAVALALTAFLVRDALVTAGESRPRFTLLVAVNLVLALACVLALIVLLARG